MTEFSLEKVEVEVVKKEYHKLNATCENVNYNINNNIPFKDGFIGGVEVQESIIDNEVPYYIIPKVVDEEGNVQGKPKFSDIFYFHPVTNDKKVIMHITGKKGVITETPAYIMNCVIKYIKINYDDYTFFTKSKTMEKCKEYNLKAQESLESED